MKKLTLNISNKNEAVRFVEKCEADFAAEITESVDKVLASDHHKIISLAGPTCSGKTTTASILTNRITQKMQNAVVMSIDDFFHDRLDIKTVNGDAPDYDSVNAIDLDYLARFMKDLLAGKTVMIPEYSFLDTARVGYREYSPRENDIYIFEGIQAVYPEVTALFGGEYKSIFISVTDDIEYCGTVLTRHEIRLMRRIVRDFKFRDATAEFTLHLWESVRENEEKSIFPNSGGCDVYINSFLPYEPFIISRYALNLLETVPKDSRYRDEADELTAKLRVFDCKYLEDCMIPKDSVFREFIG